MYRVTPLLPLVLEESNVVRLPQSTGQGVSKWKLFTGYWLPLVGLEKCKMCYLEDIHRFRAMCALPIEWHEQFSANKSL